MNREELEQKLKSLTIVKIVNILIIKCLLLIFVSPFIIIWYDYQFGLKVGLSGIIGEIIMIIIGLILREAANKIIEDNEKNV